MRTMSTNHKSHRNSQQNIISNLKNVFEKIPLAVVYEEGGLIVRVNKKFEQLLGLTRQEVIGRQSLQFKKTILEGNSDRFLDESSHTFYVRKKNGDYFWATIATTTFRQDNGLPAAIWTIEDVSRQRDAELMLRQMSLAVDQSSNSVVITDTMGVILYVNSAFVKTTGYTAEEAIGKNPSILQSGQTPETRYSDMWETITSGREWSGQFINKKKNGEIYEEHVVVAPIRNEQGGITHFIATKENITELKKARNLAEKASLAKGQFLANMSHEIRTPLSVIIGMTGLVLETELAANQLRLLSRVKSSADHLLAIVNDILDYSKIEADMLTIESHPFSLMELILNIQEGLSFLAEQKGLEFLISPKEQLDIQLMGDNLRLHQVIYNLLSNAIKFTDQGKIELAVTLEEQENGLYQVTFLVKDTGIGISQEKQKIIFNSYIQEDISTTRHYGGTGLGLSISNKLVTLMGGKLKVHSFSGLGSQFSFTLVLPRAEESEPTQNMRQENLLLPCTSLNLLLVEDNVGNQELATTILRKAGHRVTTANNGMEALELLSSGNRYDSILMDVQMPVLDGLTTTESIRRVEAGEKSGLPEVELLEDSLSKNLYGGHLHIIAMTANVMLNDRERYLRAGVDFCLPKPYRKEELLFALEKQESWSGQTEVMDRPAQNVCTVDTLSSELPERCSDYLQANFDLDQEQANNVLESFIRSLEEAIAQLHEGIQSENRQNIHMAGHRLKGALSNINISDLADIAQTIEEKAQEMDIEEIKYMAMAIEDGLRPLYGKIGM